jgi:hypothetical protein
VVLQGRQVFIGGLSLFRINVMALRGDAMKDEQSLRKGNYNML